ncbi:MAG: EAL domain-containing protein [Magnetococcus sp. DMHC-6]
MKNRSLGGHLLSALLLLVLLPIVGLLVILHQKFETSYTLSNLNNLIRIADKKSDQIDAFVAERLQDINILSQLPVVSEGIVHINEAYEQGIDSPAYRQADANIRPFATLYLRYGGYYDFFLVSPAGKVLFSVQHEQDFATNLQSDPWRETELSKVVKTALTVLEANFSQYTYYKPSNAPAAFIAAPVMKGTRVLGVVVLQVDTRHFQEVMLDNTGMGTTGETVIGQREGELVRFLLPLKSDRNAAFKRTISLHANLGAPVREAAQGKHGAALAKDYRGQEVLAVWRYLPALQVGMVIKIDAEEALAELTVMRRWEWSLLAGVLLSLLLITLYTGHFVVRPIRGLTRITTSLAGGDLSQRADEKLNDELGELAIAFNTMANTLQASQESLEERVQERTLELERANLNLNRQIIERERTDAQLRQVLTLQKAILNSANSTIIATDPEGIITSFNAAAEEKLGYSANELIGRQTPAIFHDPSEVCHRAERLSMDFGRTIQPGFEVFVAMARTGMADENEWTYIRKDGFRFPVALSVTAIRDDQGEITGFLGVGIDITQRKQTEARLLLAHKVIENANEAILITTPQSVITYVNPAYEWLTGWSREEVVGKTPSITKSGRHPPAFYEQMWHLIKKEGHWEGEVWDRRKNGEIFPKLLSISAIKDTAGQVQNFVGIFMDISQQKAIEQKLQNLAYYDPLTNLANRALFQERLNHEIAVAHRQLKELALFFIDLDRFKQVNDTLGHAAGDELLQTVARRIVGKVRESDTVARLGGDEFTVVLTNVGQVSQISSIAQAILHAVSSPMIIKEQEIRVGASIGVAIYPTDGTDFDTLTKHADMAMYLAKERGRNNYQFFSSELQERIFERIRLENELIQAIDKSEFILYYQPKYHLATSRITGMESLVRWLKPNQGMISPAKFIPVAEETGLILPMGDWILESSCHQTMRWNRENECALQVSVNLSARQFQQPDLLQKVQKILEHTGLPPTLLELEITESMLMGNVEEAITIMKCLKDMGLTLAMDDFGTGFSSLSYLKRFPVDTLKIDQSFIRELNIDSNDAAIVRTIIELAHSLRLKVVAEGVETVQQMEILRQFGCDEGQGYLLSKPLPHAEFTRLLEHDALRAKN